MSPRAMLLLAICMAVCVYSLPIEPKFRQMSLHAQEAQTSAEIEAISSRITFLQKLNKLTYDTTLFTRKLLWLLGKALTEKPSVADVASLMNKELEISKAQIEVAVEGVADELKLEVKQGIIALKAGLAFIEDNYVAGSNPEADQIIAKIKANLASLEARFGAKFGTGGTTSFPESSTGAMAAASPSESSTAPPAAASPSPSSSQPAPSTPTPSTAPPATTPAGAASSAPPAAAAAVSSSASPPAAAAAAGASSTGGGLVELPGATSTVTPSAAAPTAAAAGSSGAAPLPPAVNLGSSSSGHNNSNETSSSSSGLAEQAISSSGSFFF